MLALPDGLALPGNEESMGQVDTGQQIEHLGIQPGCFFMLIVDHPLGIAKEEIPTFRPFQETEIEV